MAAMACHKVTRVFTTGGVGVGKASNTTGAPNEPEIVCTECQLAGSVHRILH